MTDALRKQNERAFHNKRFGDDEGDVREPLDKWYVAVEEGVRQQNEMVKRQSRNAKVLEYGCADATISLVYNQLAEGVESFHGLDISDKAIEKARLHAEGLENCSFTVMDAENLTFESNAFDIVFGRGILHHLDLNRCFSEISRVLRPGGIAIFTEPMGHNLALNLFRRFTPHMRTRDEHPLLMSDLRLATIFFKKVDCRFFGLLTILAVPMFKTPIGPALMKICEKMDSILLRIPLIKMQAWSVLIVLTK